MNLWLCEGRSLLTHRAGRPLTALLVPSPSRTTVTCTTWYFAAPWKYLRFTGFAEMGRYGPVTLGQIRFSSRWDGSLASLDTAVAPMAKRLSTHPFCYAGEACPIRAVGREAAARLLLELRMQRMPATAAVSASRSTPWRSANARSSSIDTWAVRAPLLNRVVLAQHVSASSRTCFEYVSWKRRNCSAAVCFNCRLHCGSIQAYTCTRAISR